MNPSSRQRAVSISWDDERLSRLVRTIEGEIVPRLVVLNQKPAQETHYLPCEGDVQELVRILLSSHAGVASDVVASVRSRGAGLDAICLHLLAPAARELGRLWETDECNFLQVTVGLCTLHQLLRELSPQFRSDEAQRRAGRRILLLAHPGEQHTFGVSLVAQYLRRAGWDVWHEFPDSTADIIDIVSSHWLAAVGISAGSDVRLANVSATIHAIRQASRNRAIGVLLGGPIFTAQPHVAHELGADATAVDGNQAVLRADQICTALLSAN